MEAISTKPNLSYFSSLVISLIEDDKGDDIIEGDKDTDDISKETASEDQDSIEEDKEDEGGGKGLAANRLCHKNAKGQNVKYYIEKNLPQIK